MSEDTALDIMRTSVYEHIRDNVIDSQVKLNDSGVEFIETLVKSILSKQCLTEIAFTTRGLAPYQAEPAYKPQDGLRIKFIKDGTFLILTPLIHFAYMVHDGEVFAITRHSETVPTLISISQLLTDCILDTGSILIARIELK